VGRKENEDELDRLIEAWTINHSAEEVMVKMQAAGVAAGVVQTNKDIHEDPQLKHRHHLWMLEHPEIGTHAYEGPSFRLSRTPAELRMPAPCLGEHTAYVCTEILGMSGEEVAQLLAEEVFE
jgi:benzylsuccinate CoA-transferase BbsF subunit